MQQEGAFTNIGAYIHTYIHDIQTHMHTYTRTYMHTYMRTYMHTYIHTYIHACMCILYNYYIQMQNQFEWGLRCSSVSAHRYTNFTARLQLSSSAAAPLRIQLRCISLLQLSLTARLQLSATALLHIRLQYSSPLQLSVRAVRENSAAAPL